MDKPSYLFILNPNSGTSTGKNALFASQSIERLAKKNNVHAEIIFTESQGHATLLTRDNLDKTNWRAIVAIGGDGTVNEIARSLVLTNTPLGILPMGSGNGLARHLGIPLQLEAALNKLFRGTVHTIDSALLNDIPFFCTAGIGFDAYVGKLFSEQKTRGLATYMNVSFRSYWDYQPQQIKLNGVTQEVFSLTFANAGQYGNNAWVAPQASLQDGQLDICTIRTFPKWYGTSLVYRLFTRQLKDSDYITYHRTTDAIIETSAPPLIHYDGEPLQLDVDHFTVKIRPASLKIVL